MKADEAKKFADLSLAQLADALEQGKSDTLTRYLEVMSRFHAYSWGNVLLIMVQRPDATRVAGFQTWKSLGRFVKKGEKGIVIIAPMRIRPKAESEPTGGDEPGDSEASKRASILRFRAVHVFDLLQTDGEPLPEAARVAGDPGAATNRLCMLIESRGIELVYGDVLRGADGVSMGGKIAVRPGMPTAETFSVLVHELAHEMLHRGGDRTSISRTVKETEAEAVAFVVCRAVGLKTGSAASDYIHMYDGDKATLAKSLDRVQRCAAEIIEAVSDPDFGSAAVMSGRATTEAVTS